MEHASDSKASAHAVHSEEKTNLHLDTLLLQQWLRSQQQNVRHPFGVAFRNLEVTGFTLAGQYQHTVSSYMLSLLRNAIRPLRKRHEQKVCILKDFNGVVAPGEMLLVLGRPGSGCSTFLKTLVGDMHGIHVVEESAINYQGISYPRMHCASKGECLYMAELDVHFPELTVGQTLAFAAAMRPSPSSSGTRQTAESTSKTIASLFGLQEAYDTKIGNAMIRGISGGEKKRTSIAEAFINNSQLQCWDNSTRGLDSATALRFVQVMRETTDALKSTVLMSVYQASEAIYKNFDIVTLLYEGHQIYLGPASRAAEYFVNLGFVRPARATTADFLTSITNPSERVVRPGYESRVPRTAEEFTSCWKRSEEFQRLRRKMDAFNSKYPLMPTQDAMTRLNTASYSLSPGAQIFACMNRGLLRLKNNYVPVLAGIIGNTVLAIVAGSVFYNLPDSTDSFQQRSVLLFFAIMINGLTPAFEVLTMWAHRPIVEKHQRYAMYHPFIECCASILCDLPNKITTAVMFNIPIYFLTNLRRTASAWFIYLLFSFVTIMTMSMFFRMVGSLSKTSEQTMAPVATLTLIFITYAGYVLPVSYMQPWLGWLRWLNPFAYAYESLMINEFRNRRFPCSSTVPSGPAYSQQRGMEGRICNVVGARPGEDIASGSSFIAIKYGYISSHLWRNLGILVVLFIVFGSVHLLAAEYIPASRSKGEILLFQRGHRVKPSTTDEEAGFETGSVPQQQNGISKEAAAEVEVVSGIQKQTSVFHWRNINYDIKTKEGVRRILTEANGWVRPGTLTALMGPTGAGKTSLLDVLACRTSVGVVTGEAFLDGRPRDASFQRQTGYVQQEDLHQAQSTVREALNFSALLRQPQTRTREEKLAYVETVIDMLEMGAYSDAVIGVPGEGLNVEQRKRLTIAIEMVARPTLLFFLDEPTSGLDSQTAWSICTLLRKLADNGQAILCTIHQPSAQIFQMFDRLLLLDKWGNTLYFGDIGANSSTVLGWFERNGAPGCEPDSNPAEWVLDTTGGRLGPSELPQSESADWAAIWNESAEKQDVLRKIEGFKVERSNSSSVYHSENEYAASFSKQLIIVLRRSFAEYWRDPTYLYSKLALSTGVALCTGLSFLMTPLDAQGLVSIIFSVFLLTQLFSTIDQQIIPRLARNRDLFEARERRSKTYSWHVFVAANMIIELVWQTATAVLVFVAWYYPLGLWKNGDSIFPTAERGGLTFAVLWMFCLFISTLSQAVGIAIQQDETAVQIATLFFYLSLIFCGVIVSPSHLPGFWVFMYRVSPLTYFVSGTITAGLAHTRITCSAIEMLRINLPAGVTCAEYMGPYIQMAGGFIDDASAHDGCGYCPVGDTDAFLLANGIDVSHSWRNFWFLTCYVVFNISVTFALYWLVRTPRKTKGGNSV